MTGSRHDLRSGLHCDAQAFQDDQVSAFIQFSNEARDTSLEFQGLVIFVQEQKRNSLTKRQTTKPFARNNCHRSEH